MNYLLVVQVFIRTPHPKNGPVLVVIQQEGEIRRIDASTGRVTIRHGFIKSMDMPPMTMVFTAAEPGLLNNLKVGLKVRFAAEQQQGKIIVTRIVAAP